MRLDELDIVGYADWLDKTLVPHVVPPIYQFRSNPEKLLFPPFHLAGTEVVGGTIGSQVQINRFVNEGRATRIEQPIPARPDHELWIDQEMKPRYDSFDVVEKTLRRIAEENNERARRLLLKGDLGQAEQAANVALGADDRLVDSFVIKAVIAIRRGEADDAESLKQTAMVNSTAETFDKLLKALLSEMDSGPGKALPSEMDRDPTSGLRAWLCGLANSEPTASPQLRVA
jgi:hypothetical protein